MKSIFIVGLLCISLHVFAQNEKFSGYYVDNKLDTTFGYLIMNAFETNAKYAEFSATIEAKYQKYFPNDIKEYRFNKGKYYISKEISYEGKKQQCFLEYILKGKLNLYFLYKDGVEHYFLQKENDTLVQLKNEMIYYDWDENKKAYVVSASKTVQKYRMSEEYKGTMKYLLKEFPSLRNEIDKTNLTHKSLTKIAKKYHQLTCDNEECIVFEKQKKRKVFIGISTGLSKIAVYNFFDKQSPGFKDNNGISYGVNVEFQTLALSNNLYFVSGLYYANYAMNDKYPENRHYSFNTGQIYLPLQFKYYWQFNRIWPFLGIGASGSTFHNSTITKTIKNTTWERSIVIDQEFYSDSYNEVRLDLVCSLGCTVRIYNGLFLSIHSSYYSFGDSYSNLKLGVDVKYLIN
jgi:hypothetical protein